MYFVLPRWNNMEIVSTQYLQQKEVQKKFLFRLIQIISHGYAVTVTNFHQILCAIK